MRRVTFFMSLPNDHWQEVDGYLLPDIHCLRLVVHKFGVAWVVSELVSGRRLPTDGAQTREEAVNKARACLAEKGAEKTLRAFYRGMLQDYVAGRFHADRKSKCP